MLAVAESDAYLKWVTWLLDCVDWDAQITVLATDIAPSDRQRATAIEGTRFDGAVLDDTLWSLRRRIRRRPPDVLVLACTGPTVALLTSLLPRRARASVVVSGIPGVGLPIRQRAVRARLGTDVFIAHSQRERDEWSAGFNAGSPSDPPTVALATLPFLAGAAPSGGAERSAGRVVFAPQPSVPADRDQRRLLLSRLVALGPPTPIVKLRRRGAEAVTHHEPHPYDELWEELVGEEAVPAGALEFVDGTLADSLVDASCLVTVSSTAALEAIDAGCPVVIIDDFGVNDALLNGVFAGSGITAPLLPASVATAGVPDAEWLQRNYFHDRGANDWTDVIAGRRLHPRSGNRRVGARTIFSRTVLGKGWRAVRAAWSSR